MKATPHDVNRVDSADKQNFYFSK